MDINIRKKTDRTKGSVTLEASIALTIFIFLMLFMYSFFVMFEARNEMAHTMLATTNSLAFDPYVTETVKEDSAQQLLYSLYGKISDSNGKFIDNSKWYDGDETKIQQTVEQRFLHYLSGGDKSEADRILEQLNVVGGFDGLDFSKCKVIGDDLYIEISYKLTYEFQVFGMDTLEFSHKCCSKLWK